MASPKRLDDLTLDDFVHFSLWRLVDDERAQEQVAEPLIARAASLDSVMVGTMIRLATGELCHAHLWNIDPQDERRCVLSYASPSGTRTTGFTLPVTSTPRPTVMARTL